MMAATIACHHGERAAGRWARAGGEGAVAHTADRKMVAIESDGLAQCNFDIVQRFNSCNSASHRRCPHADGIASV
jgi:hypothetical protein